MSDDVGQRGTAVSHSVPVPEAERLAERLLAARTTDVVPDPDSVMTVAELGAQLRRLRISVAPLTVRALGQRAGVPKSTVSNAETGRLSSLEVVLKIVQACGCTAAETIRWKAAWERANDHRYQRGGPSTELPTADGAASPKRLDVDRMAALPIARAVEELVAMDARTAARVTSDLAPAVAAARLLAMPSETAITVLVAMPTAAAVSVLLSVGTGDQARIVGEMAEDAAGRLVAAIPSHSAVHLLSEIGPSTLLTFIPDLQLTELLMAADPHMANGILEVIGATRAAQILAAMNPIEAIGVLETLGGLAASQVVKAMAEPEALAIILAPDTDRAVSMLLNLTEPVAANLLASIEPDDAAGLLIRCGPFRGAHLAISVAVSIDIRSGKGEGAKFLDSMDIELAKEIVCMSDRRLTDAVLLAFGFRRAGHLLGLIDRSLAIKLVKSFHPQMAASVLTLVEHERASQLIASVSRKKAQEILSKPSISEWPSEYRDQLAARADGGPDPRNERRQRA